MGAKEDREYAALPKHLTVRVPDEAKGGAPLKKWSDTGVNGRPGYEVIGSATIDPRDGSYIVQRIERKHEYEVHSDEVRDALRDRVTRLEGALETYISAHKVVCDTHGPHDEDHMRVHSDLAVAFAKDFRGILDEGKS